MRRSWFVVMVALCVGVFAAACGKPPQQELDAAQAAMTEAEQAQAATYAPDEWSRAQEAMNAVNTEMEAQNAKFALIRSYGKTKENIAAAQTAAAEARDAAMAGKERMHSEAQAAADAAKASLDSAQQMMTTLEGCPRKPKGFSKDMEMMKGNWDGLSAQMAEIDAAMQREDYAAAKSQAESLKASADTLNTDLQSAKDKMKC